MTLQSLLPVAGDISTTDGKETVPGLTTVKAWCTSSASIEWAPSQSCVSSLRIVLRKTYLEPQYVISAADAVVTNRIGGVFGDSKIRLQHEVRNPRERGQDYRRGAYFTVFCSVWSQEVYGLTHGICLSGSDILFQCLQMVDGREGSGTHVTVRFHHMTWTFKLSHHQ